MNYYIPVSGSLVECATPQTPFLTVDCFTTPSMPTPGAEIWTQFIPVVESGLQIEAFEEQVRHQKMTPYPVIMGCYYQASQFVRHRDTQELYLAVGQTGWAAYFKLREDGLL